MADQEGEPEVAVPSAQQAQELPPGDDDFVVHEHPLPPEEIGRYSPTRDPDAEQGIADYVEGQARDETVQHVERVKAEYVLGTPYEMWDVTTDKNRWWVITNLTNLYSQKHFPSLDYTLSFHIGLMARLRSDQPRIDGADPDPFDEVFRRQEQALARLERAVEAEDYQAVGMQLRESLLSLIAAMRRRVEIGPGVERPQDAAFIAWSVVLMDKLCRGERNKELRSYLKTMAEKTWQLVNWLTHDRSAKQAAASIAVHSCEMLVGHFVQILTREETDNTEKCPLCASRNIRSHFDIAIGEDGAYYTTCGACRWSSHPGAQDASASGV